MPRSTAAQTASRMRRDAAELAWIRSQEANEAYMEMMMERAERAEEINFGLQAAPTPRQKLSELDAPWLTPAQRRAA